MIKRIIAENILRQTASSADPVGVGEYRRLIRAKQRRTIPKLRNIRRMTDSRGIENCNRHFVLHNIDNRCNKIADLPDDCFARLNINLEPVFSLEHRNCLFKFFKLIALARQMMSAAEIDPFHFRQERAEFFDYCVNQPNQRIGILLEQRMNMESVDHTPLRHRKLGDCRTETGKPRTRIKFVKLLGKIFRIHADAD